MAEFNRQETVNDAYMISTAPDGDGEKHSTVVFGVHNKRVMWSKVYKKVQYKTAKDAEEGHKKLKQEFS